MKLASQHEPNLQSVKLETNAARKLMLLDIILTQWATGKCLALANTAAKFCLSRDSLTERFGLAKC